MRILILSALVTLEAFAQCAFVTSSAPRTHRCISSGNAETDGLALWNYLNAPGSGYQLGDIIVVDAAGEWFHKIQSATEGAGFPLREQGNCLGKRTVIVSSRLNEIHQGRAIRQADIPLLAKLVAVRPGNTINSYSDQSTAQGSCWDLRGIGITTGSYLVANNRYVGAGFHSRPGFAHVNTADSRIQWARDIRFDRVAVYPYEQAQYGDISEATNENAFVRSMSTGFMISARNVEIVDSSILGLTGFNPQSADKGAWTTVTSATLAATGKFNATGISAALNLSSGISGCTTGCTIACYGGGPGTRGCDHIQVKGGVNNWAVANGVKFYAVYDTADSVRLYYAIPPDGQSPFTLYDPVAFDTSALGSLDGTVQIRQIRRIDPMLGIHVLTGDNIRAHRLGIDSWGWGFFTGGDGPMPASERATIVSGDHTSVTLSHTRNLSVGDIINLPLSAASTSSCCQASANCGSNAQRQAEVLAINGNIVSIQGIGPNCMESGNPLLASGVVRWAGQTVRQLQLLRSTFRLDKKEPQQTAGKGQFELKTAEDTLLDGLLFGMPMNSLTPNRGFNSLGFMTIQNQNGDDPWTGARDVIVSNTLGNGDDGAGIRFALGAQAAEQGGPPGRNVWAVNNLLPQMRTPASTPLYAFGHTGNIGGGYWRNTFTTHPSSGDVRFYDQLTCRNTSTSPPVPAPYQYNRSHQIAYNIGPFGTGIATFAPGGDACMKPTAVDSFAANMFIAGASSVATIEAAWPGNDAVTNEAAVQFVGACTFANYMNCELGAMSPGKGAGPDGRDLGADPAMVRDRINGWSDDANLLQFEPTLNTARPRPGSWEIGSTRVAVTFRLFNSTPASGCTFELYTALNRTTLHADTDDSGEKACNRTGNLFQNGEATFVLGTVSALTAGTTYAYKLTDGSRVMVGELTMAAAAAGGTVLIVPRAGNISASADMSSPTAVTAGEKVTIPQGAVRYYQPTGGTIRTRVAR